MSILTNDQKKIKSFGGGLRRSKARQRQARTDGPGAVGLRRAEKIPRSRNFLLPYGDFPRTVPLSGGETCDGVEFHRLKRSKLGRKVWVTTRSARR